MRQRYQYVDRIGNVGTVMHPFMRQWARRELEVERAWRQRAEAARQPERPRKPGRAR